MASSSKLEDLNVTQDELKRIGDALKDESFRKLFLEYAQEISDPENRRAYEAEITQMENERGMDIQFIHPNPGHVLQTSVDGQTKAFINICQNDKIEKPKSVRKTDAKGRTGMMWQIPHSFARPREEVHSGKKCSVFDVVFHPDTYRMSETNERFLKLVHDTAFDGIEKQFDTKLDRKNMKRLDDKYKGIPQATVIRSKKGENHSKEKGSEMADILKNMPYPYDNKTTAEKMKEREAEMMKREESKAKKDSKTKKLKDTKGNSKATVPEYSITHRSDLDLQEYTNAPDARTSTRPKDLIVKICLPLLPAASCASLDIFEQRLKLESQEPAAYTLDIKLPYPVNEDEGSAKFDKHKRILTVTLPVLPAQTPKLPSFIEDEKRINGDTHDSTDSCENESLNFVEAPKIEVLASSENQQNSESIDHSNNGAFDENVVDSTMQKSSAAISYALPTYSFNQDAETLSFVFSVRNIKSETITKSFPNSNSMRITFVSVGSGGFPMYYCLYLQFDPQCNIASQHANTDLTEENLVLVLLKDKSSRVYWDKFQAGVDADHLEEKLLLTDVSLQKQLKQLDEEAELLERAEAHSTNSPQIEVTEMKDKKLTINIKSAPLNEDEDDDYDPPSSADIEVIHRKAPPKLHSILKQRTLSESSDDFGCSSGDSPRSGPEECQSPDCGSRKSVSFNSHIDSATYKKNTAPTSMKTALKSKRRRARKKEEKKANSRRRRNSGSEGSSGEELSHTDSHSPSDKEEEDDQFEKIAEDDEGEKAEGKKGMQNDGSGEGSVKAKKDHQDFRTSATNGGSVVSSKKKVLEEKGADKATADIHEKCDSDDDDDDDDEDDEDNNDAGSPELDERTNCAETAGVRDECQAVCDGVSCMSVQSENKSSTDTGSSVSASTISGSGDLQQVLQTQDSSIIKVRADKVTTATDNEDDKSQAEEDGDGDKADNSVETMLSWKDKGEGQDLFGTDHKTHCAFSFSNSVIYDLDVD